MKSFIFLVFICLFQNLQSQNTIKKKIAYSDPQLKRFLDSLAVEDQTKRNDHKNYPILRKIFTEHGYPDYDLVGKKGSQSFWLLIQHQDMYPGFQDSVLTAMKIAYEKGKAGGSNYAYLTDRVKCNKGELQIYGTQMNWKDTICSPKPMIEPEKVNERRKSVGLSTEEEYIALMKRRYVRKLK